MGWTLRDKGTRKILLAVDLGANVQMVAHEYVQGFNQSGDWRIAQWEVVDGHKIKLEDLKAFNAMARYQFIGDHWEVVMTNKDGKEERKHAFILVCEFKEDPLKDKKPMFDAADTAVKALQDNFNRNVKGKK